jgi:hypothetical protein
MIFLSPCPATAERHPDAAAEGPAGRCLLLVEFDALELCVSKEIAGQVRDLLE